VDTTHILRDRDSIGLALPDPLLLFKDDDPTLEAPPGGLYYDETQMVFLFDDRPLALSPSETCLLHLLHMNAGRVCTYEDCARAIYGGESALGLETDSLAKIVHRLRKKLRKAAPGCVIETRRSIGLILVN
jgi:DNA-binding response OmpR family regulator